MRAVYSGVSLSHRIHYYYNDQWQFVAERKEVGGTVDVDPLATYYWHPYYVDALAMRFYDADTDDVYGENYDGTHYYCQDANYNVTAAVNASGTVLERHAYTPYGEVTFLDSSFGTISSSTIGNTHLYTGRELDPETGLQLNRERYYASHLGRWLTRDPIGYAAGDLNQYRYVGGMPTRYVDPSGEIVPIAVAIGIGIGIALWPDPANAPGPNDPTYPATGAGLPAGVIVGTGGAMGGRIGGQVIRECIRRSSDSGPRPSTDRKPEIEMLEIRGLPGPGPGPVPVPPRGGNVPRPIQSNPPPPPEQVQVAPPLPKPTDGILPPGIR